MLHPLNNLLMAAATHDNLKPYEGEKTKSCVVRIPATLYNALSEHQQAFQQKNSRRLSVANALLAAAVSGIGDIDRLTLEYANEETES